MARLYRPKSYHLPALFLGWCFLFFYFQRYLPKKYSKDCSWSRWDDDSANSFKVMLVADPQLVDNHTYPSYNKLFLKITQHTSDMYLKRNFKYLSGELNPDAIIFLGDYLDNGRSCDDTYYASQMPRFHEIFRNYNNIPSDHFVTSLPGNHDIGWKNGVKLSSLHRFEKNFGDPEVFELFDTVFVPVDSLSLANTESEAVSEKAKKLLDKVDQMDKTKSRILLTHVPLWRDKDTSCGPLREGGAFPFTQGHQYQTVLDPELSNTIMQKVKPDLAFSGDDHDYCFVEHTYDDKKKFSEITVKSISMTMGIGKPAVELLSITKPKNVKPGENAFTEFNTMICYLQEPYKDIIAYAVMAVVSGITIVVVTLLSLRKAKFPDYSYKKLGSSLALSPYNSESYEMQEINSEAGEDNEDVYTPFRRATRSRANTHLSKPKYHQKIQCQGIVLRGFFNILWEFGIFGTIVIVTYIIFTRL